MSELAKKKSKSSKAAEKMSFDINSVTYEGNEAVLKSEYEQLVGLLLTSFNEDKFYESADEQELRLEDIIKKLCDSKEDTVFALKACIYARTVGNMRTMPLMAIAMIAEHLKGVENQKVLYRALGQTLTRVDDAITVCAYGKMRYGRIPKWVRRAVADFLKEQNEYKLAKYQRRTHNFKLSDVVKLVHPGKTKLFTKLTDNRLRNKETWESRLSAGENKEAVFEQMVEQGKLPYMAMLRNINNMSGVSEQAFDKAMEKLSEEGAVKSSKQFPFRFLSAYKAIGGKYAANAYAHAFPSKAKSKTKPLSGTRLDKVAKALSKAMEIQASKYDLFTEDDKVAILVDTSGSMNSYISEKSTIQNFEVGLSLACMLASRLGKDKVKVYAWASRTIDITSDMTNENLPLVKRIAKQDYGNKTGWGTEIDQALTKVLDDNSGKEPFTKVFVFSDMQLAYYSKKNVWTRYPDETHIYMIDMQGYATRTEADVIMPNVTNIVGFSEAMFTTVEATEEEADVAATIADIMDSIELEW